MSGEAGELQLEEVEPGEAKALTAPLGELSGR
jgi:hypothetical protein